MKRLMTATFPNLPIFTVTRKAVRLDYYKPEDIDKLPAKYKKYLGVYYDYIDGKLCDLADGQNTPIPIPNRRNKPTLKRIMGNTLHEAIFEGSMSKWEVRKIKDDLRTYFTDQLRIQKLPRLKDAPLVLELKFYMDLSNRSMDEDGIRLFYDKVFRDCIQASYYVRPKGKGQRAVLTANPLMIIKNDNIDNIIGSRFDIFHTSDNPYLIVNFLKYENEIEEECSFKNIEYERPVIGLSHVADKLVEEEARVTGNALYDDDGDPSQYYFDRHDFFVNLLTT